jgi:nucleotide-binding universal stress UspA family protein
VNATTVPDRPATRADAGASDDRPVPRIVVGVDGSAVAAHALDQARVEARLMDADLDVVWAWTLDDVPRPFRSTSHAWADGHVAVWAAPGLSGPHSMTARAIWGAPGPKVVEAGEGADLIVVGAHDRLSGVHVHLGSVSRYVVDHATCPVMVVRGGEDVSPVDVGGPIVVGIDGSEPSRRALVWALQEAGRRQVGVIAVHGWEAPARTAGPVPSTMQPALMLEKASERLVHDELERTRAVVPPVPRTGIAVCRSGATAVFDVLDANGASLAVVGCRGRGSIVHRALGSVSHRVVAFASTPVVVLR